MPRPRRVRRTSNELKKLEVVEDIKTKVTSENRSIFDCEPETFSESAAKKTVCNDVEARRTSMFDSDSDSSLDEHLQAPSSLQNLDDFCQKNNVNKSEDVSENEESDSDQRPSEYFDFTNILKSQAILKDLSDKKSEVKQESQPSTSTTKQIDKAKIKNDLDILNVSELLAIGETEQTDDSDEDEDEEEENCKSEVPRESVEITIALPQENRRKKKKRMDIEAALKRQINATKKENQVYVHKVHLLCLIAHGIHLNALVNSDELLGLASSIIPSAKAFPPKHADIDYLEKLVAWFAKKITVVPKNKKIADLDQKERLIYAFASHEVSTVKDLVLMFVCIARVLGLKCRLMMSLQPLPLKPPASELFSLSQNSDTDNKMEGKDKVKSEKTSPLKRAPSEDKETLSKKLKTAKNNKESQSEVVKKNASQASKTVDPKKPGRKPKNVSDKTEDSVFKKDKPSNNNNRNAKTGGTANKIDRKTSLDSKGEESSATSEKKKKEKVDTWAEVFVESEEKWISVDLQKAKVHCIQELYTGCTHPMCYVLGWNNNQTIKDLTRRYAPQWMTVTRKLRVSDKWWEETLSPWKPKKTAREKEEDFELDKILQDKPLPLSITEYKNHPLYVLKRHLLKYEGIYPPDAPPLGFIKNEPVYSRLCVYELHSRETWMRQAKLVRRNETPYKIVKARPKYDKVSGKTIKDLPLELFGHWQVEDYIPPPAVDGKVPRNEYGNVELYKPSMLPAGTVHLQIPGLIRVARKLNIDCAPAVLGWEYHSGGSHPVFDGFIVCEEFKDILLDAWNKDIDESAKRNREKIEQRVYKNWKRLIRGLQIRERLEMRYQFGILASKENDKKKKSLKRKHNIK